MSTDLLPEAEFDVVLFDESDPNSLINRVWPDLREKLKIWPEEKKHFFNRSEKELRDCADVDSTLGLIRVRFWQEFERTLRVNKRRMKMFDVARGLVSVDYWKALIGSDYNKIAYILTPPVGYITRAAGLLDFGLYEMAEILKRPIEKKDGTLDNSLIGHKIKIVQFLFPIVKGPVVQKLEIDQRVLTQNIDATNLDQIDNHLSKVKKQLAGADASEAIQIEGRVKVPDDA